MIASLIKIMLAVAAALLTGKLVSRLKLPSILGWLLAGMLVGPHGLRLMDSGILDALWYQTCAGMRRRPYDRHGAGMEPYPEIGKGYYDNHAYPVTGNLYPGFRCICGAVFHKRHFCISGLCIRRDRTGYGACAGPFHRKGV